MGLQRLRDRARFVFLHLDLADPDARVGLAWALRRPPMADLDSHPYGIPTTGLRLFTV